MGYMVKNMNGALIDFDVAKQHMDSEIVKDITFLYSLPPCSPAFEQEFLSAYEHEHLEKYGTEWSFSRSV